MAEDKQEPKKTGSPELTPNSTTYDVSEDVEKALERYQSHQENSGGNQDAPLIESDEVVLYLEVKDKNSALSITLSDKAIFGRRDPNTGEAPEIDLAPYGGYQMGISRRHALLQLKDGRIHFTDLGSRNGSYINGHKIPAHQTAIVNNEDELRLGKITIILRLKTPESP